MLQHPEEAPGVASPGNPEQEAELQLQKAHLVIAGWCTGMPRDLCRHSYFRFACSDPAVLDRLHQNQYPLVPT